MTLFAGIDWASEEHALCVVDGDGQRVAQFVAEHTREGLARMVRQLARLGPPAELPISIERPTGLLVDTLLHAGHPVVPIHPNIVKASRPRYRAALAKSDEGDAYMLADLLRTDGHRFRQLRPASDEVKALRAMVRGRDDLVEERVRLGNRLRALLQGYWPGAAAIFASIDSPIALDFVRRYPTPRSAAKLGEKRLAAFMARHHYSGRRSAATLLERLRGAPAGLASSAEAEAKGALALAYAASLDVLNAEIKQLSSAISHAVAQLPTGQVVMSFPRAGKVNAAQILAELGDDPARFPSESALAAEAGMAPVTYASGKHRGVGFRWACNKRLRQAIATWANNSRRESPWAQDVYARARARGADHPHAIRILARAWIRVLWRCWRDQTLYDPANHGAARPFLNAA